MDKKNRANIKNKLTYHNKYKYILIIVIRCCIVSFVFFFACCVCYLTIIVPAPPDVECNRKCNNLEWPLICRYKFILESHTIYDKTVFTINQLSPGPSIIVCLNDIIVIDVENRIPELSITLHWHGQRQNESPFMDGVPMITQCPISSFTTFQYKFRASQVGTHYYYAYSGKLRNYGAIGKFIVFESNDIISNLYDISTSAHIALISELNNRLLVDVTNFYVIPKRRYRFRVIYGSGENGYPVKLEIKNHTLKVIAIDGHNRNQVDHDKIILNLGDRIDFLLHADKIENDKYPIIISSTKTNVSWQGLLIYGQQRKITTKYLTNLSINHKASFDERLRHVTTTIYMPIVRYTTYTLNYKTDKQFDTRVDKEGIGNFTFTFPSKPYYLLTNKLLNGQWPNECKNNVDERILGENCENVDFGNPGLCSCVHIQRLEIGEYVEIIFLNLDESKAYTYHLHGYSFFIVGVSKTKPDINTVGQMKYYNENNNLLDRNFKHPMQKDTLTIEPKTIVAIRFIADNPGYWMLRDLQANSWTRGIDLIIKVGDNVHIIKPPNTFPRCGDWVGPKYFFV